MTKSSLMKTKQQSSNNNVHPIADAKIETNEQTIVAEFHQHLSAINLIKQLVYLCRDTQKHRGLGMGLLAGNQHFANSFKDLQQQMERRINILSELLQSSESIDIDANNINESWKTIREGWHDDSVLENFQFHCHFIEQQLQIVTDLSQTLHAPSFTSETEDHNEPSLLEFICVRLPKMIEFLGMVRALSTHAATCGHHIPEYNKKLSYLCQCVQTEKRYVIAMAEKLHQRIGNNIPSLLVLRTYEFKLDAFITKVSNHIIEQQEIHISSNELFSTATEIMDIYWRVVNDGINILQHQQEYALENWCLKGE